MKFIEHEKGLYVNVNQIKFFKIEKKHYGFKIIYMLSGNDEFSKIDENFETFEDAKEYIYSLIAA